MLEWEYHTINLSDVPSRSSVADLLNDAGKDGWELVAVMSNGTAYLKREIGKPATRSRTTRPVRSPPTTE